MPDDFLTSISSPPAKSKANGARTIVLAILLAFLLGGALVAWLVWSGRLIAALPEPSKPPSPVAAVHPALPSPIPAAASPSLAAASANAQFDRGLDQRLAALEQRITRLDLQANAAAGNAGRAESLLVAFAARRAIERGTPLGPMEDQLRVRFEGTQPAAVASVMAAVRQPVTIDGLLSQLDGLAPDLVQASAEDSRWSKIRQGIGELFVIHRESGVAANPEQRLDRARLLLKGGRIEDAVALVAGLPGGRAASGWIETARRHDRALRALELIETAALAPSSQSPAAPAIRP